MLSICLWPNEWTKGQIKDYLQLVYFRTPSSITTGEPWPFQNQAVPAIAGLGQKAHCC